MSEEIYPIYDELASGGVGCIITGFTSVSRTDSYVYVAVKLFCDDLIPEHSRLVDTVHAHNCPVIVQLALGGMSIDEMATDDIHRVREMFTSAALRAQKAGYDGVQIHAAHGFFLSRTISPVFTSA